MIAAALPLAEVQALARIGGSGARAAQMHDRGQMPLLHGADAADPGARQDPGDLQVKIRRGQLDGIGRQYARVERVEPTGVPVVPRTLAHHLVSVDAIVALEAGR